MAWATAMTRSDAGQVRSGAAKTKGERMVSPRSPNAVLTHQSAFTHVFLGFWGF